MMTNEFEQGIGLMSGTSLDGIDLAWCRFWQDNNGWNYEILKAETFEYPGDLRDNLARATEMDAFEYARLDAYLGEVFADCLIRWIGYGEKPQFIASHGHTVFHRPELNFTTQIGSGAVIAAHTGIPTVCDFRTTDVALGGQGAPLVPIGDELLFSQYEACLNLGGIANVSFRENGQRVAFDTNPCNMALNYMARLAEHEYDYNGTMAAAGQIIPEMLDTLDRLEFYHINGPKSLGKEWFEAEFQPIVDDFIHRNSLNDCQRTMVEHIAVQVAAALPSDVQTLLVTGGGANNKFLIERLRENCRQEIIVPDKLTIEYKEALIFAFLGMLRLRGEINCLSSVTGAERDSCCGAVYL